jgi:branched-chain amino acid transport system substrate-binding protein
MLLAGVATAALMVSAGAEPLKIGVVVTQTGPGAVIGNDMVAGFKIGFRHAGLDSGPRKVDVIYEDDQFKPDVGRLATTKLLEQDKVVTGMIWSNVLLASAKPVLDAGAILVSANAGPSEYAGKLCHPNFFAVAFQNDALHEPGGQYATMKGVKRLAMIAPNYPAGKDAINGVKRYFKGGEVAAELYPALDQMDFAAEIAQLRAARAEMVYAFFAGAQAITFLKQSCAARWARPRSARR